MSSTAELIQLPPEGSSDQPEVAENPPRKRGFMGILQIIAIVGTIALAIVFSREEAPAGTATAAPQFKTPAMASTSAPLVRVFAPETTVSQIEVAATGSIEVRSYVSLTPQIGGPVVDVSDALRPSGQFTAGERLFTIDPRDYQLALDQALADVAAAESRLKLRQAEADAAVENYALLHGDKPVPDLVAKAPQIAQSKADLAGARARASKAELELSRTTFSLPFDGRITTTDIAVGQMLNKGQAFGQVFALDAMEVVVPIAQEDLARLTPVGGRLAEVRVGDRTYSAVVDRASAELDQRTRFARIYLILEGAADLRPGTFVDVTVLGDRIADTFNIPESSEQAAEALWVVNDGTLQRFEPMILGRGDLGLIVEAFDYGDGIVLGAVPGAREGLTVATISPGAATIGGD
jgi:RND family efflux transporter MFP subunit